MPAVDETFVGRHNSARQRLGTMTKRRENESKFGNWEDLPGGARRYWLEVPGRYGWSARYVKEADADEDTTRFWQEIRDETGRLVEVHEKYPEDKGHRKTEP